MAGGERETETRIVWGLKPSKFYCIRYKVNQLLMSIQAEKAQVYSVLEAGVRVGVVGGGGRWGRSRRSLRISFSGHQRWQHRPERLFPTPRVQTGRSGGIRFQRPE